MYSVAIRSTLPRTVAPLSRTLAAAPRFYSSTMHDNDPDVLEVEKHRNLRKEQHKTSSPIKNAPGWNQHLASASEANVKADRSDHSPEELTAATIQYIKDRHHSTQSASDTPDQVKPTNGEERLDAREATYERDEISGPLKGSGVKEVHEREVIKERVVG